MSARQLLLFFYLFSSSHKKREGRLVSFMEQHTTARKKKSYICSFPTNNALLINFLLSSDAEIFVTNHRLSTHVGAQTCENVHATCTCSDWASIFACHQLVVGFPTSNFWICTKKLSHWNKLCWNKLTCQAQQRLSGVITTTRTTARTRKKSHSLTPAIPPMRKSSFFLFFNACTHLFLAWYHKVF